LCWAFLNFLDRQVERIHEFDVLQPLLIALGLASSSSGAKLGGWKGRLRLLAWGVVMRVLLGALIGSVIGLFVMNSATLMGTKDAVALGSA